MQSIVANKSLQFYRMQDWKSEGIAGIMLSLKDFFGIFGTLMTEQIHGERYVTRDQARGDIVDYTSGCFTTAIDFILTWAI